MSLTCSPCGCYENITIVVSTGLSFGTYDFVQLHDGLESYIYGEIVSYDPETGEMVLTPCQFCGPEGSAGPWTVSLSGIPGAPGSGSEAVIVLGNGLCSSVRTGVGNDAAGDFSFAGGGSCNTVCSAHASIEGGQGNLITAGVSCVISQEAPIFRTTWDSYYNNSICDYNYYSKVCVCAGSDNDVTYAAGQSVIVSDGSVSYTCNVLSTFINNEESSVSFQTNLPSTCFSTCSAVYDNSFCVNGDQTSLFASGKDVILYMCSATCCCSTISNVYSSSFIDPYTCVNVNFNAYTDSEACFYAACVHNNDFTTLCFSSCVLKSDADHSAIQSGSFNRIESPQSFIGSGCCNLIVSACNVFGNTCAPIIGYGIDYPSVVICTLGCTCCSMGYDGFTVNGACNTVTVSNVYDIFENDSGGQPYTEYVIPSCTANFCCQTFNTCSACYTNSFCIDGDVTSFFPANSCICVCMEGDLSDYGYFRVCSSSFVNPYTCVELNNTSCEGTYFCSATVLTPYTSLSGVYPSVNVNSNPFNQIITGCANAIGENASYSSILNGCNNLNQGASSTVAGHNNINEGCNAHVFGCCINNFETDVLIGNRLAAYCFNELGCNGCFVCVGNNGVLEATSSPVPDPPIMVASNGFCSTVRCGVSNNADGCYSAALGGFSNIVDINSDRSVIVNGIYNRICNNVNGFIGGGYNNCLDGGEVIRGSNFIGGGWCNSMSGYTSSSAIVGGLNNCITGTHSFLGGGYYNCVLSCFSALLGGYGNTASAPWSTLGGGFCNTASAYMTFIGGGYRNISCAYGSTVSGGYCNSATGQYSSISGGSYNAASGNYSTVGGGRNNTVSSRYGVISGGQFNTASNYGSAVVSGCYNDVPGCYSTITNGVCNLANNSYSFIGNGVINTASGSLSSIVNGSYNSVLSGFSSILGGSCNTVSCGSNSSIGGGCCNIVNSLSLSTISGGYQNLIFCSYGSIIGGGNSNNICCSYYGFIGAGCKNTISAFAFNSFIGSGACNVASGLFSSIPSGCCNITIGTYSSVIGGLCNTACADFSSVYGIGLTNDCACSFLSNCLRGANLSGGGDICANAGGTIILVSSDCRMKECFQPVDYQLCDLNKLNPTYFQWKDEYKENGTGRQVGFIAQEVKQIVPEAVGKTASGYYTFNSDKLIPILTKSVQILNSCVDSLSLRISELERLINNK